MPVETNVPRYSRKLKAFEFELESETEEDEEGNPKVDKYVLKEMKGRERDRYLGALNNRMQGTPGTKSSRIRSFDGIQADLLSKCIFKEGVDKPISVDELQDWPSSLQQLLHDKAQEMCGLTTKEEDEEEDEAKND